MSTNAQLVFTHPELARRYDLLTARMWARGWDLSISSSTRSDTMQREWYWLYLHGQWPALVADPDRYYCPAPPELGGWPARGSMHTPQADGWSHALDLAWVGPRADQVHNEAYMVGLHAVEPTENWHFQCWDPSGMFTVYEDDDMFTPETFASAIGHRGPDIGNTRVVDGIVQLRLSDDPDQPGVEQWWSYADVMEFIHRHMKHIDTGQ